MSQLQDQPSTPILKKRELSGTAVVLGMLLLGILATSFLFVYFELHTRPFRPLREAIGRAIRHSRPNVEGGQVRGRGPHILRISLSVPFDPHTNSADAEEYNQKILAIARQHQDLSKYQQVQINQIFFEPQKEAKRRTFDFEGQAVK